MLKPIWTYLRVIHGHMDTEMRLKCKQLQAPGDCKDSANPGDFRSTGKKVCFD